MSGENKNQVQEWLFRIILAVSVIAFGVFRHLFGLNEIVGSLLESGFASSSQMALVEVHLITILELMFVVWTLFLKIGRLHQVFAVILLVIYWLSFALSLGNTSFVDVDLTSIYEMSGVSFLILITILNVLSILKWKVFQARVQNWISGVICLLLVVGYSGYYVIASNEFSDLGESYDVQYANWDKYWEKVSEQQSDWLNKTDYTLCFFSVSCSHCNETAKRLGVYREKFPDKEILLVFFAQSKDQEFWNSNEVVDDFMGRNHLDLPYLKLKDYEAIILGGNEFPAIIEMIDKKPAKHYVGGDINAYAFDHLFK